MDTSSSAPQSSEPVITPQQASPIPGEPLSTRFKYVKRSATVGLVLGALLVVFSIALFLWVSVGAIINVPFAIAILVYARQLKSGTSVDKVLITVKVLYATTVALAILSFATSGRGFGLLPLLLVFYLSKALTELYDAGLTTSKVPISVKAKV